MNDSQKHYAKWSKSDVEDYILRGTTYKNCPEKNVYKKRKKISGCLDWGWEEVWEGWF